MTRTIPTKEQVLQAASECPQTKDALKILFPEDFKSIPIRNIEEHFVVINGAVLMSPLVEARLGRGSWTANRGIRGPEEILRHPNFKEWKGIYISGEFFISLINDILALEE